MNENENNKSIMDELNDTEISRYNQISSDTNYELHNQQQVIDGQINNINTYQTDTPIQTQANSDNIVEQSSNQQIPPELSNQNLNNKPKKKKIGLLICIIFLALIMIVGGVISVTLIPNKSTKNSSQTVSTTKVFYGKGYELEYDSNWSKSTASNSSTGEKEEILMYKDKEAYLIPIGVSSLSELTNKYNVDFTTEQGQKTIYNTFYSYWNSDATRKIYNGSNGFNILKDNIYYATMDYGTSASNIEGKHYLIISNDNNIVISFRSNINGELNKNSERILKLLKAIIITKKYDDGTSTSKNNSQETLTKGQRIGNEEYGYVTVPDNWYKFYDVDGNNSLQYSYANTYIVSLNVINGSIDAETAAKSIVYGTKSEEGVQQVSYNDSKIGKYNGYLISTYYSDGTWLYIYLIKAEDNKIHYISIEGPDKNSEYFNIPSTFSLKK